MSQFRKTGSKFIISYYFALAGGRGVIESPEQPAPSSTRCELNLALKGGTERHYSMRVQLETSWLWSLKSQRAMIGGVAR